MKRQEMAELLTLQDMNSKIDALFEEWETLYQRGNESETEFVSDGLRLNILRGYIVEVRQRRDKRFKFQNLPGQLRFDGGEVQEERALPPILPSKWNNPKTEEFRRKRLAAMMQQI